MNLTGHLLAILLAPYASCECGHPQSHHDALGRCHSCGCCTFFPKQSIGTVAEGSCVDSQGERAGGYTSSPSIPPFNPLAADWTSADGRSREGASQPRFRAVFVDRWGNA